MIITTDIDALHRLDLNNALRLKWGSISTDEAKEIAYYCTAYYRGVFLWFGKNVRKGGPIIMENIGDCYLSHAGKPGNDEDMEQFLEDEDGNRSPYSHHRARFTVAYALGDGMERHALFTGKQGRYYERTNTMVEALRIIDEIYTGFQDDVFGFPISRAWWKMVVNRAPDYEPGGPPYVLEVRYNRYILGDSPKVDRDCEEVDSGPEKPPTPPTGSNG